MSSERLESQLIFEIDADYLKRTGQTAAQARAAALTHWREYHEQLPGVHIIGRWRNPDNSNPRHANWKTSDDPDGAPGGGPQSLGGFFQTIHGSMEYAEEQDEEEMEEAEREEEEIDQEEEEEEDRREEQRQRRSRAMKNYHAEIRRIMAEHPRYTRARAQAVYRAKKIKLKRKSKRKAKVTRRKKRR